MSSLNKKILLIGLGCFTVAASYASASGLQPSAPRQGTSRRTRTLWTEQEDARLRFLVRRYGTGYWSRISSLMPGRNARQCRERWRNYLAPGINHSEWTEWEDALLLRKHDEFGSQWTQIAAFFYNRTAENIKNRWRVLQRRDQRPPQTQQTLTQQRLLPQLTPLFPDLDDFFEFFK
jgi:hypothetical protein